MYVSFTICSNSSITKKKPILLSKEIHMLGQFLFASNQFNALKHNLFIFIP